MGTSVNLIFCLERGCRICGGGGSCAASEGAALGYVIDVVMSIENVKNIRKKYLQLKRAEVKSGGCGMNAAVPDEIACMFSGQPGSPMIRTDAVRRSWGIM